MTLKGTDVMFIGSFILILISIWFRKWILQIGIPFMIIELSIAIYLVIKKSRERQRKMEEAKNATDVLYRKGVY
jgi:hypothetical protein